MIWLRNRLAQYELHVAEYYLRRRAYVAASRRCQIILEKFQGTDSVHRALEIMETSYSQLGLKELASNARTIRLHNFPKGSVVVKEDDNGWWPL